MQENRQLIRSSFEIDNMQKIVLASGNVGKLRELREILADKEITLVPQSEFD